MRIVQFLLFRHGETDWNKVHRIQGSTDTELNSRGIEQAEELAKKMVGYTPELVISSDLQRAYKTGEKVAESCGIEIRSDSRLREANFGEAEGKTVDEIKKLYGEELWYDFRNFDPEKKDICFPGGETRWDSIVRMRAVINEVIQNTNYQIVAISTHGGVVGNLLRSYQAEGDMGLGSIKNCELYELYYENGNFKVRGPLK